MTKLLTNQTTQSVASPLHPTFVNDLDLWPMTLKSIQFIHPSHAIFVPRKINTCIHLRVWSIVFRRLYSSLPVVTLTFDIYLQYQLRINPLFLGNICAKFEQNTLNDLISIVITRLFPLLIFLTLTFDLWPVKSIGFILSSWATSVPCLIKIHSTVWSVVFTSLYPLLSIVTLTSDLQIK